MPIAARPRAEQHYPHKPVAIHIIERPAKAHQHRVNKGDGVHGLIFSRQMCPERAKVAHSIEWLGDLDSNQGCPGQSREFYR